MQNDDVLSILQKNSSSWITAQTLAFQLNVTERTIKNRIKRLRKKGISIKSGPQGYQIDSNCLSPQATSKENLIPQNKKERKSWLVRKLISAKTFVNIYDLSQELFINEVELRKEIQSLTNVLGEFNLTLVRHGDRYRVLGDENDKRKILSSMIYQELQGTLLSQEVIQKSFPKVNVKLLKDNLTNILKEKKIKIDSFDFYNILLHLVIMINRSGRNKTDPKVFNHELSPVVSEISKTISQKFGVQLSDNDILQLEEMFELLADNHLELKEDSKIDNLLDKIIIFVKRSYSINLNEALFKKRFLPHLIRLIQRYKDNSRIHNPLTNSIKQSSPTIYECACLIAYAIKEDYGIEISEEEIAFIALHVGNSVAEQIQRENKVFAQLFMVDYHGNVDSMVDKLNSRFGKDLVILDVISDLRSILPQTQMIIVVDSTEEIRKPLTQVVYISNFLLPNDINKLEKAIRDIQLRERSKKLSHGLKKFTSSKDFFINDKSTDQREVIAFVAKKLSEDGAGGKDFKQKLFEREKLSTTSFGLVALPHAIDYDAKKSKWFIYLDPKGISWFGHKVYLVLALAYSSKDEDSFRTTFDELSSIIINDRKVSDLIRSKNYKDFVDKLTKV